MQDLQLTSRLLDGGWIQGIPLSLSTTVLFGWRYLLPLHDINLIFHLNSYHPFIELCHKWMLEKERVLILTGQKFTLRYTLSSSSEVGLLVGSLVKHWSMKLTNLGLHLFVCLRRGGGFLGMRNKALIGCILQRAERE